LRRTLLVAIAKAAKAIDKYIVTRTINANPETKNAPSQAPHPDPPLIKGVPNPCHPPVTANIIIAAKSGLARKLGKGEQNGTVKKRKSIMFMDADVELRLKQELKKTPTAETRSALLATNRTKGKMAAGGMQPARLNTMT